MKKLSDTDLISSLRWCASQHPMKACDAGCPAYELCLSMEFDISEEAADRLEWLIHLNERHNLKAKWGKPFLLNGHWCRECSHCLYTSTHGDFDNKEFVPLCCSNCGAVMENE